MTTSTDTERRMDRIMGPLPYVLLLLGTLAVLVQPELTVTDRLAVVGAAAVVGGWILGMLTLPAPVPRRHRTPLPSTRMVIYTYGQLILAGGLLAISPLFFIFAVIGFIQAYELLTPRWAFTLIFLTSAEMNVLTSGIPNTFGWWTLTVSVVLLQTGLIGWFGYLGAKYGQEGDLRKETVARLEAALAENAGLHAQLVAQAREAGVLDERQRMAREIHDTIAQGLTGIITQLQAADRVREDNVAWQRHLDNVQTLARDSLAAARRSVAAMRPAELEASHLPDAVTGLAERWTATTGTPVSCATTGDARPVGADIEVALFRTAQEALTNVAKHAGATKVGVTLSYLDDMVMLDVRDDGAGFEPDRALTGIASGFGLDAIRQRLAQVKGTLTVETAPGEGTAINATVPVAVPA